MFIRQSTYPVYRLVRNSDPFKQEVGVDFGYSLPQLERKALDVAEWPLPFFLRR